ncbi:pseudouridine synthase [Lindgomyces ingoldianus]|uniref:Pseudouridine synthase n=1 Tax=Lindgomyces ingoldianus TaxID=673940 RepID=A0ACB6R8C1_9PLEO|nr:pseudouridine synthase [Lindgomyces ingoldianus]KAF2475528.1 pseudouridine synthase [Lindgomyces ingoldianus]
MEWRWKEGVWLRGKVKANNMWLTNSKSSTQHVLYACLLPDVPKRFLDTSSKTAVIGYDEAVLRLTFSFQREELRGNEVRKRSAASSDFLNHVQRRLSVSGIGMPPVKSVISVEKEIRGKEIWGEGGAEPAKPVDFRPALTQSEKTFNPTSHFYQMMKLAASQLPNSFPELENFLHRLFCSNRRFHKLSRIPRRSLINLQGTMSSAQGYEKWNQKQLIARIQELEAELKHKTPSEYATAPQPPQQSISYRKPPKQPPKAFDASKYSTRLIALKFAYLGQKYNGFEHHNNNNTPLPTIEEELWKALMKTRLINPTPSSGEKKGDYDRLDHKTFAAWDRGGVDMNWEGCEYSKCGRTDRGVSAFGQVIGVRVRSNRPIPSPNPTLETLSTSPEAISEELESTETSLPPTDTDTESEQAAKPFNDILDELPYIQLLNRVLPPDIRIYAWCPNPPPDFSARFSCRERRYKYFFTNPCFSPNPDPSGLYLPTSYPTPESGSRTAMREGWLDIDAMKQGCSELVGLHDFRNFCKIDASKQLTNFQRRIFYADIEEISPLSIPTYLSHQNLQLPSQFPPSSEAGEQQPKMYAFTLHGSAFLWHQVRSIIALLFLIGQGLESPSLIPSLLDIASNPTRPKYEMASDAPLVLWDCVFPAADEEMGGERVGEREQGYKDALEWIYVGDPGGREQKGRSGGGGGRVGTGKWGRGGVMDDLWEVWRGRKMEETLAGLLMDVVASQGEKLEIGDESEMEVGGKKKGGIGVPRVFDGGDVARAKGNYIPVLERERQEPVEVVNERFARKKGLDLRRLRPNEDVDA